MAPGGQYIRAAWRRSFMRAVFAVLALLNLYAADNAAGDAGFAASRALARQYLQENNTAAALPWLEKAWAADPANYDNAYDLALARLQTKDLAGARRLTEDLLARQNRGELHNLLGDIEEASGDFDAAAREYETAARMDPSEKNLFDLGTDLLRHNASQQALTVFRYAAPLSPNSARIQIGLGIALYSAGQFSEAVQALCHAVDMDPGDTRALGFLGGMYDVAPELSAEVDRRLARFADLYPQNAAANYYYALSLRRRTLSAGLGGNEQKVETLLRKAVTLDPTFVDGHVQLALLYVDEQKTAPAIREFETAVRLKPELKSAHYHLSRLYQQQGRTDLARRELAFYESLRKQESR